MNSLRPAPLLLLLAVYPPDCAPDSGPPVVPGIRVGVSYYMIRDTVVYQRTVTRAGVDTAAGSRTVVSAVSTDTRPWLEVTQRFPSGAGEIVDTAVSDLRTLRAISHRSHQPTKTMRFEFDSSEVRGVVNTVSPAATDTVRQDVGGAIFDSNIIEMVVSGLPLRSGFTAELPFFIYERGGRVPMMVTVTSKSRVQFPVLGKRLAWIVSVAVPGAPATMWIDDETRTVLRVRYDIAARGLAFTDDRITRLKHVRVQRTSGKRSDAMPNA